MNALYEVEMMVHISIQREGCMFCGLGDVVEKFIIFIWRNFLGTGLDYGGPFCSGLKNK